MPEILSFGDERRRSPRYSCGGRATVRCLPSDDREIFANLRNLSSGGICLDTANPMVEGTRAEIVVSVNAISFRAAAVVKAQRETHGARLQFLQLSAGAKDVLADLLERLAKLQALTRKLRSDKVDPETEQRLLELGRLRIPARWGSRSDHGEKTQQTETPVAAEPKLIVIEPTIEIDLFG
jgi:PilZ domain